MLSETLQELSGDPTPTFFTNDDIKAKKAELKPTLEEFYGLVYQSFAERHGVCKTEPSIQMSTLAKP